MTAAAAADTSSSLVQVLRQNSYNQLAEKAANALETRLREAVRAAMPNILAECLAASKQGKMGVRYSGALVPFVEELEMFLRNKRMDPTDAERVIRSACPAEMGIRVTREKNGGGECSVEFLW